MKITTHVSGIIGKLIFVMCLTSIMGFAWFSKDFPEEIGNRRDGLHIQWKNNTLTISGHDLPGKKMNINYLEAFCKTGSTNRKWDETTIPHETELISAGDNDKHIK